MRIVSYNIRYGLGRDGKYDLGRITDSIEGADIIALQEVERYWLNASATLTPTPRPKDRTISPTG